MARALRLARRGLYTTDPNPRVGCVLVRDGEILAEGWHRRAGEPHAERIALAAAGERARGATAYVTLEPCCHQGRTPPCADALIAAGVARVVAAMVDPNPLVAGKGLERLRRGRDRDRVGPAGARGPGLEPWIRQAHGAGAALVPLQARRQSGRTHRHGERREPLDQLRCLPAGRAAPARPLLGDPHRGRDPAGGRSIPQRPARLPRICLAWSPASRCVSPCGWCWTAGCAHPPRRGCSPFRARP